MATAYWYGQGLLNMAAGSAAWTGGTVKVALTTSSYTPNQDTHDFFNDVTNELSTGGGYTAGGAAVANRSLNYDSASNVLSLRCDDLSWTSFTGTARYAVVYKDTGVGSTSPLFGYIDLGGDQVVTSGTFTLDFSATDGVLKITAS